MLMWRVRIHVILPKGFLMDHSNKSVIEPSSVIRGVGDPVYLLPPHGWTTGASMRAWRETTSLRVFN